VCRLTEVGPVDIDKERRGALLTPGRQREKMETDRLTHGWPSLHHGPTSTRPASQPVEYASEDLIPEEDV
jgi:hypothetical protein